MANSATSAAPRHMIVGPFPAGSGKLYGASCGCGWSSALYERYGDAVNAWRDHCGNEPRADRPG